MSSHHEWVEEVVAQHDATTPFAPENGQPLRFHAEGHVIYTNPDGVEFRLRILGLYQPAHPCGLYALVARYLLDTSSSWMPVPEARLRSPD
ncbi:hypothetical protein AL486_09875 [Pandoraea apista]|uniref:hypothetical protein n=1 Tax=Pandoraea apista TaxID=93218 RepID=UPI000CE98D6C|nr:hypothetical protein [Pandoraea apista]AVF39977.1 hypothetical protein AL486_09875 [Pandoraea apista]